MHAGTCTLLCDVCGVSRQLQDSHLRRMLGTRPVRAAGGQGGRLVVFNCLLVAGWKIPSHPLKDLQGYGVPFVGFGLFVRFLFILFYFIFFLGGGSH